MLQAQVSPCQATLLFYSPSVVSLDAFLSLVLIDRLPIEAHHSYSWAPITLAYLSTLDLWKPQVEST